MKLRDLDRPAVDYVLTLLMAIAGYAIATSHREADDMKARIAALEAAALNCKP
jgi:hypothetical protein